MNLVLIGYRATGKTTLARHLAQRLGWDWIDADVEIEQRAGKSIARIFAEQGEPAFRDLEADGDRRSLRPAHGWSWPPAAGLPCGRKAAGRCGSPGMSSG